MSTTRRLSLIVLGAAIALGFVVLVTATFARPDAFASPAPKTETITIPWKVVFQLHQAAPPAISWGDTLQATYTFTSGTTGTADFVCTAVATPFLCQGIMRLPQGDIYVQTGPVDGHQPAAIVGGTRAFVGVTGQFTQQENPDDTGTWILDLRER